MSHSLPRRLSSRWQATLIALALVLAFSGGAVAKGQYDARNADRVDGKHAVSAGTSIANRKGKLVATDPHTGRLPSNIITIAPNSKKLGGFSHKQTSSLPLLVQGAGVSGSATPSPDGVEFAADSTGEMRFGFVVPPDHVAGESLLVDVVYREDSSSACSWFVSTSGLEGPDSPTGSDIHNGAWLVPGAQAYSGAITVPAGDGSAHTATFEWPFDDNPGMFIQFALQRDGTNSSDSCGFVSAYGAQLRY